ncbi:MAG: hypothetical protein ACT4P2_13480 [Pseudomonadota bacterium]
MSAWRVNAFALVPVLAAAFVLGVPTEARELAQVGPPVRLTPPPIGDTEQAPPAPEKPAREPAIEVGQPPAIDVDSIGLVDEAHGGFAPTLWQGSERALVERLIDAVPAAGVSRPVRELARRLLATTATAPHAAAGAAASKRSFIAARVERLMAMGEIALATDLAQAVPTRAEDEGLSRALLGGMWLAFDNAGACSFVRRQIARFADAFWQKSLIFCQALANEHDRAQLGLSLLREQQSDEDPAFQRLVMALAGDSRAVVDSLRQPSPLHLAMMRAARQQLPPDAAGTSDPAILRTVAASPNASAELRLNAAERAEAFGVLAAEALAQLYDAVTLTPEQIAGAAALAQADRGPRARAALFRAAKDKTDARERIDALSEWWRMARERGGYATAVRVGMPLLLNISPTPALASFAIEATRALVLAGRAEDARAWFALARAEDDVQLFALMRLAGGEAWAPWQEGKIKAWYEAQERLDARAAPGRAALFAMALAMTGDHLAAGRVGALLPADFGRHEVAMPAPALWLGLKGAAAAGRVGETALLAIIALGAAGAAGASPHALALIVDALRAVGLEGEARALILEAAVVAGL